MRKVALGFSILFHPLFVPVYALLLLMFVESKPESFLVKDSLFYMDVRFKEVVLILFVIFTILTPLLSMLFFKINKTITSYMLDNQKERLLPLLIIAGYFLLLFGFIHYQLPDYIFPKIIGAIPLGGALTLVIAAIVNLRFKLSLHLLGMGMWCAITFVYFQHQAEYDLRIFLALLLLSGFVASVRLYLKAHSLSEIIVAFVLGFTIQSVIVFLFAYSF